MSNQVSFSPVIAGTMRMGEWGEKMSTRSIQHFIEGCLEMGVSDFDHADIYGDYSTESDFGRALQQSPSLRSQIRITTKCGIKMKTDRRPLHAIKSYDSTPQHIITSVENSLQELHTDYVDVLLLHRPDFLLHPSEVAACVEKLKEQGKVKHFGVSNYSATQFELLHSYTPLVTNQLEISIIQIEAFLNGTLDQCLRHSVAPTAWSPLGGGILFGKKITVQSKRILETAERIGDRYGFDPDQILYAWLMKHPAGIVPVLGTTKLERVRKAVEASTIRINHEEWYELLEASRGHEVA